MRRRIVAALLLILFVAPIEAQAAEVPIGVIQGITDVSPSLNRFVNFRGVVVGRYEDENTRGAVYYTLFVQSAPGEDDGDPLTSDGIAVFLGRTPRPDIPLGARVTVGGKVTEFYGLTEIDDKGLFIAIEEADGPLPAPVFIDPPPDMAEQATYFEALEGMRVAYDGEVVVAGPTHDGCGFAVIAAADAADLPAIRRADDDPVGRIVPVLYPSDRTCDDIPQVKTGDRIMGMAGPLTYNFDQFKIIFDAADQLVIEPAPYEPPTPLPPLGPEQVSLISLNAEDLFDATRDTAEEGEPVPEVAEIDARRAKLAHVIADVLNCPTLIALQEVEHAALLADLSAALAGPCGFTYAVSHLETPDARGIDNALLSDPRRVTIDDVALRQTCSPVPTDIVDPTVSCPAGEEPLFGRPPLQVKARVDGASTTLFVNHFKSKRDGEIETGLERIRQAVYLNGLAAELLAADPAARIVALGDFNDTDLSPALALLTDPAQGGRFVSALAAVPPEERYTYNFGGVSEAIDAVLLSPALAAEVGTATILHTNTDYPSGWRLDTSTERLAYRVSDHDVAVMVLGQLPATPTPEPTIEPTVESTADSRPPTATPTTEVTPTVKAAVVQGAAMPTPSPAPTSIHVAAETAQRGWIGAVILGGAAIVALVAVLVLRTRH